MKIEIIPPNTNLFKMADKDKAVEKKSAGASQKIIDDIKDLQTKIEEMDKSTKVLLTQIYSALVEQSTTIAALEKTKASSRARNTAPAQTPTGKRKINNKMLFVKSMWVECRDEWVKKYFTEEYNMEGELEKMEQEMQNDKNKKKTGDAKAKAEATYFWNTYLKGKNVNKKLFDAIDRAQGEYNNSIDSELGTNKTADVEQEESEEGTAPVVASEEEDSSEGGDGDDEPADNSNDEDNKPVKGKKPGAKKEPAKKDSPKKVPSAKTTKVVRKAPAKK